MVNKYWDKGKFYLCLNNNIYFYASNEENGNGNEKFCPICKNSAWNFCSKVIFCHIHNCRKKKKLKKMLISGKEGLNAKMDYLDN